MQSDPSYSKRTLIWAIILLGVILRCFQITAPLLGIAAWRETQTAMITRNLVQDGFDVLHPRIDWFGNNIAYLALEFPLYNAIVGFLYALLGEHEIFGRLVSILFSAGSMILFYKIARLLFDEKIALYSLVFYILCPLSIFYSQTYMPESLMLFLSIGTIYFLLQWTDTDKGTYFILALIFSACAFLVKTPVTIQLFPPLLYLFWRKYGKQILLKPQVYFFFLLAYVPILLWTLYSQRINAISYLDQVVGNLASRLELISYVRIAGFSGVYVFAPHGVFLFVYAILAKKHNDYEPLVVTWLIGIISYGLIFFRALQDHHYYLVPFIPIASLYIGKGTQLSVEHLRQWRVSKVVYWAAIVLFGITFLGFILLPLHHLSKQDLVFLNASNTVKKHTTPSDLILSATFHAKKNAIGNPALLYYSDRRGWRDLYPYDMEKLMNTIKIHKMEGATYMVITFSKNFEERSLLSKFSSHKPDFDWQEIVNELSTYFQVVESGNDFVLYHL